MVYALFVGAIRPAPSFFAPLLADFSDIPMRSLPLFHDRWFA